jgi:hypothetical protein
MRDLVILRDQHCVFPGCTRRARACDLDHILPFDPHGPPGQTHPDALACLCRRHHRAKTAGAWRYHRTPDGYHWHGPHGAAYLVTPGRHPQAALIVGARMGGDLRAEPTRRPATTATQAAGLFRIPRSHGMMPCERRPPAPKSADATCVRTG